MTVLALSHWGWIKKDQMDDYDSHLVYEGINNTIRQLHPGLFSPVEDEFDYDIRPELVDDFDED